MFGIVLALLSAFSFGLSQIIVRKNLEKSNYIHISLTVTIMGNVILWPLAIAFTDLTTINTEALTLFIIAGMLAPAIARLFYFKGMQTAGISTNATIFATYSLYTTIIAVLLLGETLSPENWAGMLCIIVGVIFVGKNLNGNTKTATVSKKGLIIPVLGSLAIAASQIVRKEALNIYSQPLLGVAVGYTTSLVVYLVILFFYKDKNRPKYCQNTLKTFWKPGVGITIGWLLSFLALNQTMVSIVAPVLQTELLFILLLGYIFLRKLERFTPKLVASALLIVAGVILISIN
ncbi:MAG: DMT family transporter [Candidatus Bathyarchaeota archaeon]|nr:DMT family transporter [Candidatus Bathyarchaeota archaeon]